MSGQDDDPMAAQPFSELRSSGLLWLINRVVFHPRGFALALSVRDGEPAGWKLLGDGSEVWRFEGDEDVLFEAAMATLNERSVAAPAQCETERPWCGAPRDLGGQQPCPLAEPCDARTCRLGSAVSNETYRADAS